jgi:CRP-like cAMP-binding protein
MNPGEGIHPEDLSWAGLASWARLRWSPDFERVSPESLQALASSGAERAFQPGEALMRQGEPSSHLYVVFEGDVEVRHVGDDGVEIIVASLGSGQPVGEMGLLAHNVHTNSVVATTQVDTLEVHIDALEQVMGNYPDLLYALVALVQKRLKSSPVQE